MLHVPAPCLSPLAHHSTLLLPPPPPSRPSVPLPPIEPYAVEDYRLEWLTLLFAPPNRVGLVVLLTGARKAGSHPVSPNLDARSTAALEPSSIMPATHSLSLAQFFSSAGLAAEILADFRRRRP